MANSEPIATSVTDQLLLRLDSIRKRLFSLGVLTALGWTVLATVGVMIFAFWFDLIWELSPQVRRYTVWFALLVGIGFFLLQFIRLRRQAEDGNIAHQLDALANTGGQISSGLQLATGMEDASPIEQGLAQLAVGDAAKVAGAISENDAVSSKPLKLVGLAIGGLMLVALAVTFAVPKLLSTEIVRFVAPDSDVPTFTTLEFQVTPGNTSVHYGQPLDIELQLNSSPVDEPQLVLYGQSAETVPMFPVGDRRWRATLFKVKNAMDYQVHAGRAKSSRFHIDLISVPSINDLQFRLTPPAYTRLGERVIGWQDSISGLQGTKVEVVASSNMPLTAGVLKLTNSTAVVAEGTKEVIREVTMTPVGEEGTTVVGRFELRTDEKFELQLTNTDQIQSTQSVSGSIALLKDQRPFVRLTSPKPSSLATATIQLPVTISAEDDFGISKISLYRSLNQSRSRPQEIAFENQATRLSGTVMLPLNQYDLKPGDILELFARAEDNRPELPNGVESPVHSVKIISQQQYQKMNRERLGVEAVLSKYRMIQRRLEDLELQQRAIEAMEDGDEPDNEQNQRQARKNGLKETKENFEQAAMELRDMAQQQFPIDFDKELADRIAEMSEQMLEIAEELAKLEEKYSQGEIDNETLKERLKELREKLEGIRGDFQDEAMDPLAQLAQVFELMTLQQQFVQLVAQQQGLASRLKSLDGNDNALQPDARRRMRERADEQSMLKRLLDELLLKIENNALILPVGGDLDQLRETSLEFVAQVVDSDAGEEQDLARSDLAEFSGSGGYAHAKKAAKILVNMLDEAEQMGEAGQQAGEKIFNPGRGRPQLGDSMKQMMELFGPQNGSRMAGKNNRGLYGDQPQQQAKQGGGRGEENRGGSASAFSIGTPDQAQDGNLVKRSGGRVGSSQIKIPLRYQRQVGEYYRRIVDETGE